MNHFERLGLPRRFSVVPAELERSYLSLSRTFHPDFHHTASDAELGVSLDLSATLNEAYNTLRDPFARAEYLLTLAGGPTASEQKQLPPAFLAEMLEAREELERSRGVPAKVERLEAQFEQQYVGILTQVGDLFARYEALKPDDGWRANLLGQIRGQLNAAKFVRGLLRDLHEE